MEWKPVSTKLWVSISRARRLLGGISARQTRELGCWFVALFDSLNVNDTYYTDPEQFPSGMKSLSEDVRALNLQMGLYTTPGNM
mgnify:CR=1 FL=1